jgi:hypothetical protein
VREALLLDLGAIVFELNRQGRREPDLLHAKELELRVVDEEVRGLADALEEGVELPQLTASGLVARCTACDRLMGSRDRFCPACGAVAGASDRAPRDPTPAAPLREPDFGDTIEVTALNAADHPAFDEPDGDEPDGDEQASSEHAVPARSPAPWSRPPAQENSGAARPESPAEPRALVPRAQRKLRAGRRMARQWLEQHRSDGP